MKPDWPVASVASGLRAGLSEGPGHFHRRHSTSRARTASLRPYGVPGVDTAFQSEMEQSRVGLGMLRVRSLRPCNGLLATVVGGGWLRLGASQKESRSYLELRCPLHLFHAVLPLLMCCRSTYLMSDVSYTPKR